MLVCHYIFKYKLNIYHIVWDSFRIKKNLIVSNVKCSWIIQLDTLIFAQFSITKLKNKLEKIKKIKKTNCKPQRFAVVEIELYLLRSTHEYLDESLYTWCITHRWLLILQFISNIYVTTLINIWKIICKFSVRNFHFTFKITRSIN